MEARGVEDMDVLHISNTYGPYSHTLPVETDTNGHRTAHAKVFEGLIDNRPCPDTVSTLEHHCLAGN